MKENFQPVNAQEVLSKVAALPLSRWNYKEDKSQQHLGPMAQDFYAAFATGPDDKHIAVVDKLPMTATGKIQKHVLRSANQTLFEGEAR